MDNGVKYEDKHSITDWDLILVSRNIGEAEADVNYLKVPGLDGEKDLTEAFGEVKYLPRVISSTFDMFQNIEEIFRVKDEIINYLSGKKVKIIYDSDPNYYYYGRCKISFNLEFPIAHIIIEAKCDPYKYKINKTDISNNVTSGNTYSYSNDRKTVIPTLTLSSAMTLKFNGATYSLNAGTKRVLSIEFVEGINKIEIVTGSGTLKVEYQEARL